MTSDKTTRQNRVREALGRLYDQEPPYFREYLRRFREDPTSRVFAPLAEAYRRLGRIDEAIDICREGLEHHPEFHGGRVALAKCLIEKHDFEEAIDQLEKVVQAVPENLLAQRLLGDCYLSLGRPDPALHCFKMALLLSPSDVGLAEKVHDLEQKLAAGGEARIARDVRPPADAPQEREERSLLEETEAPWGLSEEDIEPGPGEASLAANFTDLGEASLEPDEDLPFQDLQNEEPVSWQAPGAGDLLEGDAEEDDSLRELDEVSISQGIPGEPEEAAAASEALLSGEEEEQDEAFRVEHVSAIFGEEQGRGRQEITTETLGDLYYSQGQYDKALRIFDRLLSRRRTTELERKAQACRVKLGVDARALARNRKVAVLRRVLKRVRTP